MPAPPFLQAEFSVVFEGVLVVVDRLAPLLETQRFA